MSLRSPRAAVILSQRPERTESAPGGGLSAPTGWAGRGGGHLDPATRPSALLASRTCAITLRPGGIAVPVPQFLSPTALTHGPSAQRGHRIAPHRLTCSCGHTAAWRRQARGPGRWRPSKPWGAVPAGRRAPPAPAWAPFRPSE